MAEGVTLETPASDFITRYFCHSCHKDVTIESKEIQCPECHSECIEELSLDAKDPKSFGTLLNFLDGIPILSPEVLANRRRFFQEEEEEEEDEVEELDLEPNISEELLRHLNLPFLGHSPEFDLDIEQHLDFNDHWINLRHQLEDAYNSDEDVDNLASQLLDEIEISGPPPLKKEQIKAITSYKLTREEEKRKVQCTVCMDDFKAGDEVKKLNCEHLFHEPCITPWLEKQASCPNCRVTVKVECPRRQSQPALTGPLNQSSRNSRRFSESTSIGEYFNAMMGPFRFL